MIQKSVSFYTPSLAMGFDRVANLSVVTIGTGYPVSIHKAGRGRVANGWCGGQYAISPDDRYLPLVAFALVAAAVAQTVAVTPVIASGCCCCGREGSVSNAEALPTRFESCLLLLVAMGRRDAFIPSCQACCPAD